MIFSSFSQYAQHSAQTLELMQGDDDFQAHLEASLSILIKALSEGLPLLVCGNGGSAADAAHITAELVGRFMARRKALRCICLGQQPASMTSWGNDVGFESAFAREVEAYGKAGGVLLAISTSGNSENVLQAIYQAKEIQMDTIALTGGTGGALAANVDQCLIVPSDATPLIQQAHQCVYHYLCYRLEEVLGEPSTLDPK